MLGCVSPGHPLLLHLWATTEVCGGTAPVVWKAVLISEHSSSTRVTRRSSVPTKQAGKASSSSAYRSVGCAISNCSLNFGSTRYAIPVSCRGMQFSIFLLTLFRHPATEFTHAGLEVSECCSRAHTQPLALLGARHVEEEVFLTVPLTCMGYGR